MNGKEKVVGPHRFLILLFVHIRKIDNWHWGSRIGSCVILDGIHQVSQLYFRKRKLKTNLSIGPSASSNLPIYWDFIYVKYNPLQSLLKGCGSYASWGQFYTPSHKVRTKGLLVVPRKEQGHSQTKDNFSHTFVWYSFFLGNIITFC